MKRIRILRTLVLGAALAPGAAAAAPSAANDGAEGWLRRVVRAWGGVDVEGGQNVPVSWTELKGKYRETDPPPPPPKD